MTGPGSKSIVSRDPTSSPRYTFGPGSKPTVSRRTDPIRSTCIALHFVNSLASFSSQENSPCPPLEISFFSNSRIDLLTLSIFYTSFSSDLGFGHYDIAISTFGRLYAERVYPAKDYPGRTARLNPGPEKATDKRACPGRSGFLACGVARELAK